MVSSGPVICGRRIRLTYLITDLEVGGVPLHLLRLVSRLPPDRVSVRVISLAGEGPVGAMLRRAGVPVQACGAGSAHDLAALVRLYRLLRKNPPDLLHSLLFHANVAARVIGRCAGIPSGRIITEIQTVEVERKWHLLVDNLTCRLSRFEVGNSRSVVEHLHRRAHIPRERLRCEMGAVDVLGIAKTEAVSRASLGVGAHETLLLWTGRLDPVKGFEEMLAAVSMIRRSRPIRFLMAGEGEYRPMVERLIRQHGLTGCAELIGQRSDVWGLLKTADLFLFCSRTEGLPNAVLEAMAAGLPIVATAVPGCRDLIISGSTGLLVGSEPAEIAAGVLKLLQRPNLGTALGEQAQQWVRAHADIESLGVRWMKVYEHCLSAMPLSAHQ